MLRLERDRAVVEGGICLALWRGGGGCRSGSGGYEFVFEVGGVERGWCRVGFGLSLRVLVRAMEIEIDLVGGARVRGFVLLSLV